MLQSFSFLPISLLPTSPHFALTASSKLEAREQKREGKTRSQKREGKSGNQKWEGKSGSEKQKDKSGSSDNMLEARAKSEKAKQELKVSSLPFLHFFFVVFLRGVVASSCCLLLYV